MDGFEKLINANDLIEWIMETYPDWCVGVARSIVDHINGLPPAQTEQRWIPCKERPPEENGEYLITVKYKHEDGYDDIYTEHGEWYWDRFYFSHCGEVERSVLAWRELPEPYKEEQDVD